MRYLIPAYFVIVLGGLVIVDPVMMFWCAVYFVGLFVVAVLIERRMFPPEDRRDDGVRFRWPSGRK